MNARKWLRYVAMVGLTAACGLAGYGFYRANQQDSFTSVCFTVGILGIILSVFRRKVAPDADLNTGSDQD